MNIASASSSPEYLLRGWYEECRLLDNVDGLAEEIPVLCAADVDSVVPSIVMAVVQTMR